MAGKTLIGGTAYTVSGGKTLIGSTGMSINGGKTLIGGTGYDITFGGGPWNGYLYESGDEHSEATGGWSADGYSYSNNKAIHPAEKQTVQLYGQASYWTLDGYGVGIGTVNPIDLTDFSTLKWRMSGTQAALMIVPSKTNFVLSYAKYMEKTASSSTVQDLDISDLSGDYYIVTYVMNNGSGGGRYFATLDMWLE